MRQFFLLAALAVGTVMMSGDFSSVFSAETGKQTAESLSVSKACEVPPWESKGVAALGEAIEVQAGQKETLSYLLFLPSDESAKTDAGFPLILFLHGAGERGDNLEAVKTHGPPKLVETKLGASWPFITVSPQCPEKKHWSAAQMLELLDSIEANYPVDKSRVYVTGISMGGFGTWTLLATAPERFAAAIPICGGGDPAKADQMLDTPIWVCHGASDSAVPVEMSEKMVQAIWALGGTNVKLTEYVGVDHDCWTQTYANPEFYTWLLKQSKAR